MSQPAATLIGLLALLCLSSCRSLGAAGRTASPPVTETIVSDRKADEVRAVLSTSSTLRLDTVRYRWTLAPDSVTVVPSEVIRISASYADSAVAERRVSDTVAVSETKESVPATSDTATGKKASSEAGAGLSAVLVAFALGLACGIALRQRLKGMLSFIKTLFT